MDNQKDKTSNIIAELKAKAVDERISSFLKMRLVELSPGYAKVTLKLTPDYQNFNGFTFGGIIMAIADQAFAYGSNSASYPSVASQFNIYFMAGPAADDELIAECKVLHSGRRAGVSEITVTNQDGKLIAKATGTTIPISEKT